MERFFLDSSAIIALLGAESEGTQIKRFLKSAHPDYELITNVICHCEVLNKSDLADLEVAEAFLSKISVFPISIQDGLLACNLQFACRKKGGQIGTLDSLIAASAIANDAELLSLDSDFERIEGLKKHLF